MAAKKPTVKTKLQQKAGQSNKILTGPKGSKPQSTTNTRLMKQGDKTTMSGPARTRFQNPNSGASAAKGTPTPPSKPVTRQSRVQGRVVKGTDTRPSPSTRGTTPSGGGKNLFGGAGDKNMAIKQAGPKAPKPTFKTSSAPFSKTGPTRASLGNVKPGPAAAAAPRQRARAMGQAAVRNAQQRRANLAKVQQDLRGQVGRAASILTGPAGKARQAIYESVAPRPTSKLAGLKEGQAAAKAAMKAKSKSADSFGGQYQKPKAGAKPKAAPKMSKAKSFDNAFASARNSGMKTFVWEGKSYNTKKRGEK